MVSIRKTFGVYVITIIASIFILTWVMELWMADLEIPFTYSGDAIFGSMSTKGMIENGWFLHNNFVGAPFGLDMYDFPGADAFNFLLIKIISLFTSNFAVVYNLYFLLTFPLTALTAVYVFRCFKVSSSIAIVFALLFSFLPYHFFRGQQHLFLAAYYMIPLITMLVLWIGSDKPIFFSFDEKAKNKFKIDITHHKSILSIIVSLITGSTGIYYAFFACFLIAIAGISTFFYKKNRLYLLSALILVALISSSVFLNLIPSVFYNYNNGKNPEVAQRSPMEAELYGLKIIHLLLPVNDHRVAIINELKNKYKAINYPLQNENTSATLGFIGSLGFLALLSVLIFGFNDNKFFPSLYKRLAVLNLSAVLLATIGGFGSLFAFLFSPQIRTYNRISIFIAFFSLFAAALFLEAFRQKYVRTNQQKYIFYFFLIILLSIGIFDQTTKNFVPPYATTKEDFLVDHDFVATIEKTIPADSMIFQLPYVPFPEYPPVYNMGDYELFKGYLHSHNLRWSYGAMKGRNGNWQRIISEKPMDEFLTTISLAGFSGIYIDRNGYADRGAQIEAELTNKLNVKQIVSKNNRLVFFDMVNFNAALKEKYTAAELEELKEKTLYPLELYWLGGFSDVEGSYNGNWRWSSAQGELKIKNALTKSREITLEMSFSTGWQEVSNLYIEGRLFSEHLKINSTPTFFQKKVIVPPGEYVITFTSDAKRVDAPLDPRFLVFRVWNFSIKELE